MLYLQKAICDDEAKEEILYAIKEVIAQVMPTGARVVLFGSQARNDAREDSDWDILILLDKEKLEEADHDKYVYPLFELGWKLMWRFIL